MPRIGIGADSPDKELELEVDLTSDDIIAELNKEGDSESRHMLIELSAYNGIGIPDPRREYWANRATENPPPLLPGMKCQHCGVIIESCQFGNTDCDVKRHHSCNGCWTYVGLGLHDPCWILVVNNQSEPCCGTSSVMTSER